jgi:hypothetical protein
MKLKPLLFLALLLPAVPAAFADSTSVQLTRGSITNTPFSVKSLDLGASERYWVTYQTNGYTQDKYLLGWLHVCDENGHIGSTTVSKMWNSNGVLFLFTIPSVCLPGSKFSINEAPHTSAVPAPAADEHWFYLTNFLEPGPSLCQKYFESKLRGCATNEIRSVWFVHDNPYIAMVMVANFRIGMADAMREDYGSDQQRLGRQRLDNSQIATLKQLAGTLPPPDKDAPFASSIFVAIHTGDKPEVFQYDRRHAPPVVHQIYNLCGATLDDGAAK